MGKTDRQAIGAIAMAVALIAACKSNTGNDASRIAYRPSDDCVRHTDSGSCTADGCEWYDVDVACREGNACPTGICVAPDPCVEHTDEASCAADPACAWAATDEYCPPGAECGGGGFCYARGDDDCTCVCPAWCEPGEDGECAPCECDCDGGGGGGDCPWVCPACDPSSGEPCPPCTQDCGGTCTWICPDCGPDADFCGPCYQQCEPGCGGGEPPCACVCPACVPGEECPPCDCTCGDDPVPYPLPEGEPAGEGEDDPIDCTCACPQCLPGVECGPCECDCGGGGSCGGDPGPSEPPVPGDPGDPGEPRPN